MADSLTARILVAHSPGEIRAAVLAPRLEAYAVFHPGFPDQYGDVWRAPVLAHQRGLGGAFVALGADTGFLPDSETTAQPQPGSMLLVRVVRAAHGRKGVRLTARLTDAEQARAAAAPPEPGRLWPGPDPVAEFAACYPQAVLECDDPAEAARREAAWPGRVRLVRCAIDPALAESLDRLAAPNAAVPGGGSVHVTPTEALTAIDIDTGALDGRTDKRQALTRFNQTLIPALARQIRLRNLGGAILVDFAGLAPPRRRAALSDALHAALAADPGQARLLGFTALGFAEITRRRARPPLHESLASAPALLAAALRAAKAAVTPTQPLTLGVAPDLMACWDQDRGMRADAGQACGPFLRVQADPGCAAGCFRLRTEDP